MVAAFLKAYFSVSFGLLACAWFISYLVDPLWYNKGNKITQVNDIFNERVQKMNLLLRREVSDYDCLIIGNSKITALNSSFFKDNNCFNYAYNAGNIEEYLAHTAFLKEKGVRPEVVFVGVDDLSFKEGTAAIQEPEEPDSIYKAYLSLDIFLFSLKSLFKIELLRSLSPRYYNEDFEVRIREGLPDYIPKISKDYRRIPTYSLERARQFEALRNIFPAARYVAFVPPISSWYLVNEIYKLGLQECYFAGLKEATSSYDRVVDFTIPSQITTDPKSSYDATHYYLGPLELVAQSLEGQDAGFGIELRPNNFTEYREQYLSAVDAFLESQDNDLALPFTSEEPIIRDDMCLSPLDEQ